MGRWDRRFHSAVTGEDIYMPSLDGPSGGRHGDKKKTGSHKQIYARTEPCGERGADPSNHQWFPRKEIRNLKKEEEETIYIYLQRISEDGRITLARIVPMKKEL